MKRLMNIAGFFVFGLVTAFAASLLLKYAFTLTDFLAIAMVFVFYRVIVDLNASNRSYVRYELRKWWVRRTPENTITFSFIGGFIVALAATSVAPSLNKWAMGFVATAITQMSFELVRGTINSFPLLHWKSETAKEVEN